MITYSDAVEHLVTHLGGGADDRVQARVRLAVYDAYRRVTMHPKGWRYYIQRARVNLNGLYDTGTVTYVASTRTFTLADGTFPSWAASGEIRLGLRSYKVETNPTSTTVVIGTLNAPTEDIADATEYQLVQTAYPLPASFQDVYVVEGDDNFAQQYIHPSEWYDADRCGQSVGGPIFWTVMGNENINAYGRKSMYVYPAPTESQPHDFLMRRRPRDIRFSGQSAAEFTGTVTISAGSTSVTGSGTSFSSRMVGSVLRVTDGTSVPTGLGGLEPYTEEAVISAVGSATDLTLQTPMVAAYSTAKFRISDPLDIDDCMEAALRAAVNYEWNKVNRTTEAEMESKRRMFLEELNRAWEIDTLRGIGRAGITFYPNEAGSRIDAQNNIVVPD